MLDFGSEGYFMLLFFNLHLLIIEDNVSIVAFDKKSSTSETKTMCPAVPVGSPSVQIYVNIILQGSYSKWNKICGMNSW